jgi:kynurenine 3-monooxygenase
MRMNQRELKPHKKNNIIVGAGISGLALAILLARQGHRVSLYDKRTVFDEKADGRSINFTISGRGMRVIEQLGLADFVLAHSSILVGRLLHLPNDKKVHYKYGTKTSHVLYAISRSKLIEILMDAIAVEENILFYPSLELVSIDEATLTCKFSHTLDNKIFFKKADCIIGADGVFSKVRQHMLKSQITSFQQTVFDWGYKEYQFNSEDAQKLRLNIEYMHMWPRPQALLVAIPNLDKTFSVIFTAPLRNSQSDFNHFDELVKQEFPEIAEMAPSFFQKSGGNPFNYLISIKIDAWHIGNKIVLLGDACHATYPFYGQGMNSALEDAYLFSQYFNEKENSRLDAFICYEKIRKNDTNALHDLSEAHLEHMTKAMISPFWQACNILECALAKLFSNRWKYEYELVAHSSISYSDILSTLRKQNKKKVLIGFYLMALLLSVFIRSKKFIQPLLSWPSKKTTSKSFH